MSKARQLFKVTAFHFRQWRYSPRIIMTFILAFILCLMLSEKAVSFAEGYQSTLQIYEVFIWTFGDRESIMLSSLLLILLFADMPFFTQATPYYLVRTSRSIWVAGQILYIMLATIIYTAFLLLISCIICAPISFPGNQWSKTAAMLGYSGAGAKIALPASVKAMELTTPLQCMTVIFLLVTLYSLLAGLLMLLLNLWKGNFFGVLSVFILNLTGLCLNPAIFKDLLDLPDSLAYRANVAAGWLSPLNHATYYMHNFGYDLLPAIWMSAVLFFLLIALLVFLIRLKIKTYPFIFTQSNE